MKFEIYQVGKTPPLTTVECDDYGVYTESPISIAKVVFRKNQKPIAYFMLNNIAGFKKVSED